jgi:HKD family nuclease
MDLLLQPWSERTLGDILQLALKGEISSFERFDAAVAFAKRSGVQHVADLIRDFAGTNGGVRIVVGIDQHGTSAEGLSDLLAAVGDRGSIWIFHDSDPYVTFHPKLYLFRGPAEALLIIGSGNLTQGGLYSNDEACSVWSLDLHIPRDLDILQQVDAAFDQWCNPQDGTVRVLDAAFLQALIENDDVRSEAQTRTEGDIANRVESGAGVFNGERLIRRGELFGHGANRRRPRGPGGQSPLPRIEIAGPTQTEPQQAGGVGFVMTLMRTDVGVGQLTPGTSRRSPEIFVPLAARDAQPGFWGWQDLFVENSNKPGKWDRRSVLMKLEANVIRVNMMTWPDKHDFRLRAEALRSAGEVGDILRIEQSSDSSYSYAVEVIPSGTSEHQQFLEKCTNSVSGGSLRKWGYYTF